VVINGVELRIRAASHDELGQWLMDNYPSRCEDEVTDEDGTRIVGAEKPPRTKLDKELKTAPGAEIDRTDRSLLDGATPNVLVENDDEAHAR